MVMKIIDVPYDVDVVRFYKGDEYGKSFRGMVSVSNIEDAPEKRVIELPSSLIRTLSNIKESNTSRLMDFLNYLTYDQRYRLTKALRSQNIETPFDVELANWYLGHVEFVAKKEPKFKVLVELHEGDLWVTKNRTNDIDDEEISFSLFDNDHDTRGRYKFTEEEADELVAGLTALTARKVKVAE